jgi:DNA topoisomerase-1
MKPAILDTTTVDIQAGEFGLRASGSIVKFQGFLIVYEEAKDEDKSDDIEPDDENAERKLPPLEQNQPLNLKDLLPRQHFTQPPPRYTEATLVKALEENGIGRPSTYAQILTNWCNISRAKWTCNSRRAWKKSSTKSKKASKTGCNCCAIFGRLLR